MGKIYAVSLTLILLASMQLLASCGSGSSDSISPAPFKLIKAENTDSTTLLLTFNNDLDPSSVINTASFSLSGGINVVSVGAVISNTLTLTTDTMSACTTLQILIDSKVKDISTQSLELSDNTVSFLVTGGDGGSIVINEVDYDNPGTDTDEFIELYNPSPLAVSLSNKVLILFNGNTNPAAEYTTIDLSVHSQLCPGKYIVINSGTVTVASSAKKIEFAKAQDNIQDGAPDGMAIVNMIDNSVFDALSYEGDITAAQLPGGGTINLVEGAATASVDNNSSGSLARCPNGTDTDDASADWSFVSITSPGSANRCTAGKLIFVSASLFTGDLVTEEGSGLANGIAAADALCMGDTNYPGYGTYKALIVDGTNRVASLISNAGDGQVDWVLKPGTSYYRSDATTSIMLTDAKGIFVFGTLDNAFVSDPAPYWSGLSSDWTTVADTPDNQHCDGWTYGGDSPPYGSKASADSIDSNSIYAVSGASCNGRPAYLVCVEQ